MKQKTENGERRTGNGELGGDGGDVVVGVGGGHQDDVAAADAAEVVGVGLGDGEDGGGFEQDGLVAAEAPCVGAEIESAQGPLFGIGEAVVVLVFDIVCTNENGARVGVGCIGVGCKGFEDGAAVESFEEYGVVVVGEVGDELAVLP